MVWARSRSRHQHLVPSRRRTSAPLSGPRPPPPDSSAQGQWPESCPDATPGCTAVQASSAASSKAAAAKCPLPWPRRICLAPTTMNPGGCTDSKLRIRLWCARRDFEARSSTFDAPFPLSAFQPFSLSASRSSPPTLTYSLLPRRNGAEAGPPSLRLPQESIKSEGRHRLVP